jgi:dihydrofolate reductase
MTFMRRVRYAVAMSLDGYIAGPKGEADWIAMDPEIDFTAIFSQFDTLLVGRRTFDGLAIAKDSTAGFLAGIALPGAATVIKR